MSVIFRVVGANETVKDLLNKDLKVVSKSKSATGSVIFNIKNDGKTFLFEQKEIDFHSDSVHLNGFLSDGHGNAGVAQLKFIPQTYNCP